MEAVPGLDLDQPPFDMLDAAGRARVQACVDMGYHPRGETIIEGGAPSERVVLILKGHVHARLQALAAGIVQHVERRLAQVQPGYRLHKVPPRHGGSILAARRGGGHSTFGGGGPVSPLPARSRGRSCRRPARWCGRSARTAAHRG